MRGPSPKFADVVDESVQQLIARHGATVRRLIELEAAAPVGFDDAEQRAVKKELQGSALQDVRV